MKRLQVRRADIGAVARQPFGFKELRLPLQHFVATAPHLFGVGIGDRLGPHAAGPLLLFRIEFGQLEPLHVEQVLEIPHPLVALVEVLAQLQEPVFPRTGWICEGKQIKPVAEFAELFAQFLGLVRQGRGGEVGQAAQEPIQRPAQHLAGQFAVGGRLAGGGTLT